MAVGDRDFMIEYWTNTSFFQMDKFFFVLDGYNDTNLVFEIQDSVI